MTEKPPASDAEREKKPVLAKLQKALELELSTIPPYLTAMFSIPSGTNIPSSDIIRSVFIEEMLHMTLAGNLISSLGGRVRLGPENIPEYPLTLEFEGKLFLEREFEVDLAPFSPQSIQTFLLIEMPSGWMEPAERQKLSLAARDDLVVSGLTIGDFYEGIKRDLIALCKVYGEDAVFSGDPAHQINEAYYWSGGGKPIVVTGLQDAIEAIDVIVDQGEGAGGSIDDGDDHYFNQPAEVAHFFRFNEIAQGRYYRPGDKPKDPPSGKRFVVDYDEVYPILSNAHGSDYAGHPLLKSLNDEFNRNYSQLLSQLEQGFSGNPKLIYTAIRNGMENLASVARQMVRIPLKDDPEGRHGAPSFEWQAP